MEPTVEELQKKVEQLQKELNEYRSSTNTKVKISHSADFWSHIRLNCTKATVMAQIKSMINAKQMTVHDTNDRGRTLLSIAAVGGAYDLAKYLINHVETPLFSEHQILKLKLIQIGCRYQSQG